MPKSKFEISTPKGFVLRFFLSSKEGSKKFKNIGVEILSTGHYIPLPSFSNKDFVQWKTKETLYDLQSKGDLEPFKKEHFERLKELDNNQENFIQGKEVKA